jgi:hypothetical protein
MIEGCQPDTPTGKTSAYAVALLEDDHIATIPLQLRRGCQSGHPRANDQNVGSVLNALHKAV